MAAQLRAVRARIRAVKSIAKITRAQELIASSRIVRAQQRTRAAEPYARELTTAVEAVVSRSFNTITHPMITEPETVKRSAAFIITSDGGFAGAYNANVLRESNRLRERNRENGVATVNYVAGRKGIGWHRFRRTFEVTGGKLLLSDDDEAVTPLAAGEVDQESVAKYNPPADPPHSADSAAPDNLTGGE